MILYIPLVQICRKITPQTVEQSKGQHPHPIRYIGDHFRETAPESLNVARTTLNVLHEPTQSLELSVAAIPRRRTTILLVLMRRTLQVLVQTTERAILLVA